MQKIVIKENFLIDNFLRKLHKIWSRSVDVHIATYYQTGAC